MSDAFIVRRGGRSAASAYAAIGVTYPSGSICTASDGGTLLTAADTSGIALFIVPNPGTWIVTINDGIQTASSAVEITTKGQVSSVKLSYGLILYDTGTAYTDITGNWTSVEYYDDHMAFPYGGSGGVFLFAHATAIDATEYSTLHADLTYTHGDSSGIRVWQDVVAGAILANLTFSATVSDRTEFTLDLSGVSGNIIIGGYLRPGSTFQIHKLWLT